MRLLAAMAIMTAAISPVLAQSVLTADVIRQSFSGNTAEVAGQSGVVFVFYAPDGTQRMQNPGGSDTGSWRITAEGEFCGKWARLRSGAEACAPVIDLGGGNYQWGNAKFRLVLGNPKNL
jgi:hypothetical protein